MEFPKLGWIGLAYEFRVLCSGLLTVYERTFEVNPGHVERGRGCLVGDGLDDFFELLSGLGEGGG